MVELRNYQEECLNTILAKYKAGVRRQLVCLPTGTGKTVVFAQFPARFRLKNRMLVLAHREELLEQARDKILRANPNLRVEIEQADRHASAEAAVVVASVPTLGRADSERIGRLNPDTFFLFVVDEAHHATADTWSRALARFGVFEPDTRKLVVGFTATPKRGDGTGLSGVFQEIVFSRSLPDMVSEGYLSPLAGWRVETDTDLTGVKTRLGDFISSQLSSAVNLPARNAVVVKAWQELLRGRPTLCFCVDVDHAKSVEQAFRKAGVRCAAVVGSMDREDRRRALADFREGKIQVLANCMLLTEGYDEPSVSGIILARPTKSALLYTQMIGRGTRLHPGKENVTVVDIVDVTRDQKLVTLPALFGLSPAFDLQGNSTAKVHEAFAWVRKHRPWVSVDDAYSLKDLRLRCRRVNLFDMKIPEEIGNSVDFAWMREGTNGYRLHLSGDESLHVAINILGHWETIHQQAARSRILGLSETALAATALAERFVREQRADCIPLVSRRSKWRRTPASERQLAFLKRRNIVLPTKLTKGHASHLIGMLSSAGEKLLAQA